MQDDGDLRDLRDWGSKLPGAIVRVAALLHVASRAGESTVITGEAMAAAIRLAPYLTAHAGHAFAVMTGHINSDKPRRLEQSMLRRGKGEYSVRDLKHTLTWDEDGPVRSHGDPDRGRSRTTASAGRRTGRQATVEALPNSAQGSPAGDGTERSGGVF